MQTLRKALIIISAAAFPVLAHAQGMIRCAEEGAAAGGATAGLSAQITISHSSHPHLK